MEKFYVPSLLASEGKRIAEMFPERAPVIKPGGMDDELKQLILTLVRLKPSHVSRFGKEKSESEVSSLAGYVCTNTLNVKCDNIYALLDEYASKKDWETLFGVWQNYPDNNDAREFLLQGITKNVRFQSYLSEREIEKTNLSWMNSNDKVRSICFSCGNSDSLVEYTGNLKKMGLLEDTLLMITCLAKFYLNCSAKAYKEAGESGVFEAFSKLPTEEKIELTTNFVRVFALQELRYYQKMYLAFEKEKTNIRFRNSLDKSLVDANLMEKYDKWKKMMTIIEAFDNEDPYRIQYWLRYANEIKDNRIEYFSDDYSKVLIMVFEQHVITEFGGKAEGKAYLFSKKDFDRYKWYIPHHTMSDYKYKANHDDNLLEGMSHNGGYDNWWYDFDYKLRQYGIRPSKV